ncbi:NAD(P)-dependent oxidoreductase [Halobacillus andaensis]|uniref:NAD(P)-dependent oxidoreductase n=1 Tax=Halobacillus andaensis TaxID=1176239 RepID=A0A917B5E9_HALAA|nr:SDR family oxidoreductase [Halobacillus andaensis]MBP2006161.1 short-subunit dehydrogenase [Halobacillus andaensis]GGF23210.1 NAD(P)-dependent oxidoreductase [Halobacillus andaensis]
MRKALISGAGTGLGRALALQYAQNDYNVVLTGRTERKLLLVQKEIKERGGEAEVLICDVTEPSSVQEAFKQLDHIDVLINNAGLGIFGNLSSYNSEDIDQMMNTNVKGTILMTQAAMPFLKRSNGRVLNIISTAGLRGKTNETVYCASKFAVRGFTESLHKEWESEPMKATAVYMGGMNTPFWDESDHVSQPENLKGPEGVAKKICDEDDGRPEIFVDR